MENINFKKDNYYVFVDISGSLTDFDYINHVHGPYAKNITLHALKPQSVNALDFLLEKLEEQYDTKLIITSNCRNNFVSCLMHLSENGLVYDKPIFATDFVPGKRGKKIVNFMEQKGEKDFKYPKIPTILLKKLFDKNNSDFSKYVVIDDTKSAISKHIPKSRFIHTNQSHQSLTQEQVENYLQSIGLLKQQIQPE